MWAMMSAGMAQAEHELQRSMGPSAELPAFVKRPDPKTGVEAVRRYKNTIGDREELPERDMVVDAGGKRNPSKYAERMVHEMADQIGEQHQPAGETDLPDADAADDFLKLFGENMVMRPNRRRHRQ